jgi:hypothetical protein
MIRVLVTMVASGLSIATQARCARAVLHSAGYG